MTDQLTDDEIRVRIAEACGWKGIHFDGPEGPIFGYHKWENEPDKDGVEIPDYTVSLDAMAEAEATLPPEKVTDYINAVYHVTFKPGRKDRDEGVIFATARQRALAFIRTI